MCNCHLLCLLPPCTVALTEFGSDCDIYDGLNTAVCQGGDAAYLRDIATFLRNEQGPAYNHNVGTAWYWWSWNANSGDTKGVVADSGPAPWYAIKWYKVRYLEGIGLCPWYRTAGSC